MDSSQVSSKGQMVIPARLRKKYGIEPGTEVRFIERDGEILLQPVTASFVRSVRGLLRGERSATKDLLAERARDRTREEVKVGRRRPR